MRVAELLTRALAAFMATQALLGVLLSEHYRDPEPIRTTWFGNDWITLALAVPLLLLSRARAARGFTRGLLLWLGMIAYAIYNYAFLSVRRRSQCVPVAFVWNARVTVAPLLHVRVRDAYLQGEGSGHVSLLSAIGISAAGGTPEMNSGSLHRLLAEAVWYPVALLPGPHRAFPAVACVVLVRRILGPLRHDVWSGRGERTARPWRSNDITCSTQSRCSG